MAIVGSGGGLLCSVTGFSFLNHQQAEKILFSSLTHNILFQVIICHFVIHGMY